MTVKNSSKSLNCRAHFTFLYILTGFLFTIIFGISVVTILEIKRLRDELNIYKVSCFRNVLNVAHIENSTLSSTKTTFDEYQNLIMNTNSNGIDHTHHKHTNKIPLLTVTSRKTPETRNTRSKREVEQSPRVASAKTRHKKWNKKKFQSKISIKVLKKICPEVIRHCTNNIQNDGRKYMSSHYAKYKGDKGDAGKDGNPGPKGMQGVPGPPGKVVYVKVNGTTLGVKGDKGAKGESGVAGAKGLKGETGSEGPLGPEGKRGRRGRRGKNGMPGLSGEPGLKGEKGDRGRVEKKTSKNQNCTCKSIVGPAGPRGPQGIKGDKGHKGEKGDIENLQSTTIPSTLAPRIKECVVEIIGTPLFKRYSKTYWGSWMKDAAAERHRKTYHWTTRHFTGSMLYEYRTGAAFETDKPDVVYDLGAHHFQGTGHVVFQNNFYYHYTGFNRIVKFDLTSKRVDKVQALPRAEFTNYGYLYSIEYNYLDFSVDQNGLWVIYGEKNNKSTLLITKLDPQSLKLIKTWEIFINHPSYGNGFIVCGVLYLVKSVRHEKSVIDFAYDIYNNKELPLRIAFMNPFSMNNMLSYNPQDNLIYGWDKGNQITYAVRYYTKTG